MGYQPSTSCLLRGKKKDDDTIMKPPTDCVEVRYSSEEEFYKSNGILYEKPEESADPKAFLNAEVECERIMEGFDL